jgi:hypothetical protein
MRNTHVNTFLATVTLAMTLFTHGAQAAVTFTGKITWLEVWASGNVAFRVEQSASAYCNGQFIVNFSWNGSKNLVATLLAAKSQDTPIRVMSYVDSEGCTAAEGYGSSYIKADYVYPLE